MSRLFGSPVLWHWSTRIVLFWALTAGLGYAAALAFPFSQPLLIRDVFAEAFHSEFGRISDQAFAFALASLIVQAAAALAGAYFIAHVVLIRLAMWSARSIARRARSFEDFAVEYDRIDDRMRHHALVGHAWGEFAETLVREDRVVRNTMRPQAFINIGGAREHLFGLKMIGSVPGFFVGLGLLLTFIGLAFALHEAASATGAKDSGLMLGALGKLLAAATFKFSTSIAGLGSSLVLSLAFRTYTIWIEGAFDGLCRELERRLVFFPPQKIAAEANEIMAQSRDQLKEINSDRFFSRLGESVAPSLQSAMTSAVAPMAERLDAAMGQITQTSQSGIEDMLRKFQEGLHHGAGSELRELAGSLSAMQGALTDVQRNLSGSGEDFSRRLNESAETLNRLVAQAGEQLGGSAQASRDMLEQVVGELRTAFAVANEQITQTLATSASGAAGALDEAISGITAKLESQATAFSQAIEAMQRSSGEQADAMARAAREASSAAAAASASAAQEAAEILRGSVASVAGEMRASVEDLAATLRRTEASMAQQIVHVEAVSARSRETADAFGEVAIELRAASQPLLASSQTIASASDRMATAMQSSVGALESSQQAASGLAGALRDQVDEVRRIWSEYEQRFGRVDQEMEAAVVRFGEEVRKQQDATQAFVLQIDTHFKQAADNLQRSVGELSQTNDELADALLKAVGRREPA
jgi:hypothetical protein